MAMECDLEDLAVVCERKHSDSKQTRHRMTGEAIEEGGSEKQLPNEDEADVAGGSCSAASTATPNGDNLRTIREEDCSGC